MDVDAKNELVVQGTIAGIVCICATIAAVADVIGSSALIGVYGAALAYVFGAGVGSRLGRKNGNGARSLTDPRPR